MEDDLALKMEGISKFFPGVRALVDVSFDLRKGESHVLVGANGAGKSTLIKIMAGAYRADAGTIFVDGKETGMSTPQQSLDAGIAVIYQEFNLVPFLSVAKNIYLGREPVKNAIGTIDYEVMHRKSNEILQMLDVELDCNTLACKLSVAQQQMVEVAKALSQNARILIMDEPTAALSEHEIRQLFATIRKLKRQGVSIIYISHRMEELHEIGDRVTVLRDGRHIATRLLQDTNLDEIVGMMIGKEVDRLYQREFRHGTTEECLRIERLSRSGKFEDISIRVNAGELVGFAGALGSGTTEFVRSVYGAESFAGGEIFMFGKPIKNPSPAKMIGKGMGFLPADRKEEGLALILSVLDNTIMASLKKLFPAWYVSKGAARKTVHKLSSDLRIKTPSINTRINNLSGGNQQKVVLARWLCRDARILIFNEPTRGIDIHSKTEIHKLINELTSKGKAVILVSSEFEELVNLCDRVYVFRKGRVVKELHHSECTEEKVFLYASGGA